jgi:hypothetical protein
MGFRDLPLFNKAMLGKQGWRLMTRPDSLCAWLLKGRYFHGSDFLAATRKKHASQTWRAILAGREVLQKGLIRRAGNGQTTNIWRDKWIPNHPGGKLLTQQYDHQVMSTDLRTASGDWNVELIREVFCHFDTESILRINSRIVGEDFCSWEKEKHGMYSVRSAYRLLEEGRRQAEDTDVPGSSDDKDWKILWKFEVPPKVRVFWWRVLHGFLPARQVLYRRHIERIANCETGHRKKQ